MSFVDLFLDILADCSENGAGIDSKSGKVQFCEKMNFYELFMISSDFGQWRCYLARVRAYIYKVEEASARKRTTCRKGCHERIVWRKKSGILAKKSREKCLFFMLCNMF